MGTASKWETMAREVTEAIISKLSSYDHIVTENFVKWIKLITQGIMCSKMCWNYMFASLRGFIIAAKLVEMNVCWLYNA